MRVWLAACLLTLAAPAPVWAAGGGSSDAVPAEGPQPVPVTPPEHAIALPEEILVQMKARLLRLLEGEVMPPVVAPALPRTLR